MARIFGKARRAAWVLAVGVLASPATVHPAAAQVLDRTLGGVGDAIHNIFNLRPSDTTNWRLGVGPYVAPAFEGSKDYKVRPGPVVSVTVPKVMRVDNNDIDFIAFDRVFDFGGEEGGGRFEAGPVVNLDFGRSESDSAALRGLGNVGFGLELGGYVSFKLGPALTYLEISQDVLQGHRGATADLTTTFTVYRNARFAVGTTLDLTWATARYMKSFFGVTGAQAAASGLPAFRAGSGLKNAGLSVHAAYDLGPHWTVLGNFGYKRLLGDAADSPLVRLRGSADQFTGGVFGVYVF
jgi:outer membrane scaffolding protein for murein synthesis (MipA/OmpV family)